MRTLLLLSALFQLTAAGAQPVDFPRYGFRITLPEGWEQAEVIEANRNASVLEATRITDKRDFLTAVVQPSREKAPDKANASAWGSDMAGGLNTPKYDCDLTRIGGVDWYEFEGVMPDGPRIVIFFTVQNFHSYAFSFLSAAGEKKIGREAKNAVKSVVFSRPAVFDEIRQAFEKFSRDEFTGLMAPAGYRFTTKFSPDQAPPYIYSNYKSQLSGKTSTAVLVGDDQFKLPFGINVMTNQKPMDSLATMMVCRVTGKQFEQTNIPYQEIGIGPWPGAPKQVMLYQFRLLKPEGATMHYIFYLTRGERLDILKVQMPDGLERELETAVFDWVAANLK